MILYVVLHFANPSQTLEVFGRILAGILHNLHMHFVFLIFNKWHYAPASYH